jgi:TonB family protein
MRAQARRAKQRTATLVAIAATVIIHGASTGAVMGLDLKLFGSGFLAGERSAKRADDELRTNCIADALLASGARYSLCTAPWRGDTGKCFDDATLSTLIDLSTCEARDLPSAPIAMVDQPRERIPTIDPEPLLEMLQPEPPKPEPPKELPKPAPAPPPPPPPPPAPKRPMQVVETVKPSNEKAPDNARFLAEYDTKVEKQTVARGTPKEPMVAKSKPEELKAKQDPKDASMKEQPPDRPRGENPHAPDAQGALAMRKPGPHTPDEAKQDQKTRGAVGGSDGQVAMDGYQQRRGDGAVDQVKRDRSSEPRGQDGGGGGVPQVPNLKPTQEQLERAIGGGNVDHLEEVDNGDETALSAKRWVYASFFNRLKRQVAQNWDPAAVWRRIDPTGEHNGFKTRVTEVRVSLSAKGDLNKIVVTSPCGVGDLDDEAVRAFRSAAPFPNPPKELVDKNDLITFAFSFYFEIGGSRTSWRVIRSM